MEDEGHARPQAGHLLHDALGIGHAELLKLGRRQVVRPRVEYLHHLRQEMRKSQQSDSAKRQQAAHVHARTWAPESIWWHT